MIEIRITSDRGEGATTTAAYLTRMFRALGWRARLVSTFSDAARLLGAELPTDRRDVEIIDVAACENPWTGHNPMRAAEVPTAFVIYACQGHEENR